MLTVFVPPGEAGYFEVNSVVNGEHARTIYKPRWVNGRLVVDVPQTFFRSQLLGKSGLKWERENPEAMEWLGQNDHLSMSSNAFPGANRAPPVAPVVIEAAPVMVRLIAPEGTTSYSVNGVEHKVGKDGLITVLDHVADILKPHGFKDAA